MRQRPGREDDLRIALRALVRARLGDLPAAIEPRIVACSDGAELVAWIEAVGAAPDRAAIRAVFADSGAD